MTYDSLAACAAQTGVEKKILQRAKTLGCPGFRNARVYWDEAEPWIKKNIDQLKIDIKDNVLDINEIKRQNLIKDGKLKDLQIRQKEEELLTVEEVEDFLRTIAASQLGLLSRYQRELPVKISGKNAGEIELELKAAFAEIIDILKSDISKWK